MEIKQNYIPHNFRNKYLKNTGGYASSSSSISTGGNGLPYVLDENGNYVVEKQVLLKKSIISKEEVVAYGEDNVDYVGTYAPLSHPHGIDDITGLQEILDNVGSGGTCSIEVIDNLDSVSSTDALSARQGKILSDLIADKTVTWDTLQNKPSTFTPSAHSHAIANVTGLQTQLDSKVNTSSISTLSVKNSDTVDNLHASSFMRSDANTTCTGTITCANLVSNGEITAYSDRRLKTDIQALNDRGLLNPVTYIKDGKRQIGFIAQEVQEAYAELITEDVNGYLSLNYQQLTAVLSAQINDLYSIINELKLKITELKNEIK